MLHKLNGKSRRNKEIEALHRKCKLQAMQWNSELFILTGFI